MANPSKPNLPNDVNGRAVNVLQLSTNQNLTTSGSSAATTNPINSYVVRVATTADCYITFGSAPTATTSSVLLTAGAIEYFTVAAPGVTKMAAIQVSGAGVVSVTEVF